MPSRWLQVKGDPSVRAFLFEQSRQTSLFDENIDRLHRIMYSLTVNKGGVSHQGALLLFTIDLLVY